MASAVPGFPPHQPEGPTQVQAVWVGHDLPPIAVQQFLIAVVGTGRADSSVCYLTAGYVSPALQPTAPPTLGGGFQQFVLGPPPATVHPVARLALTIGSLRELHELIGRNIEIIEERTASLSENEGSSST